MDNIQGLYRQLAETRLIIGTLQSELDSLKRAISQLNTYLSNPNIPPHQRDELTNTIGNNLLLKSNLENAIRYNQSKEREIIYKISESEKPQ